MIEKLLPEPLTLSTTFYDVLCNPFSKARKAQIWAVGNAGVNRKLRVKQLKLNDLFVRNVSDIGGFFMHMVDFAFQQLGFVVARLSLNF